MKKIEVNFRANERTKHALLDIVEILISIHSALKKISADMPRSKGMILDRDLKLAARKIGSLLKNIKKS